MAPQLHNSMGASMSKFLEVVLQGVLDWVIDNCKPSA